MIRLVESDGDRTVTVVGNLLGVQPGESVRLQGQWITDARYGRQFRADSYLPLQPATREGIERYLGSGLVAGIGKTMAGRIVDHFGLDTLEVIEEQAERLTEVDGIGAVRATRIQEAWREQRGIKEIMLFLHGHGVSPRLAVKIYRTYGANAVARLRENPYRLAFDVFGVGFKSADQIATQLGIPADSPRRAEAGVHHVLSDMGSAGHVYSERSMLVEQAQELLQIDGALVDTAVETLAESGWIVIEGQGPGAFVYTTALYRAEVSIVSRVAAILSNPGREFPIQVERAVQWYQELAQIELASEQELAIRAALGDQGVIVTGGPGTGKTTVLNGIVQILEKKRARILLAAPTGRAAKRLQETTGREAWTLHRLLDYQPRTQSFHRNPDNPLPADLIIVDEMSMVDTLLFQSLMAAVPSSCRVVLVGDIDQLPSVGAGNVLRDLIDSDCFSVVRLTRVFRQGQRSTIVTNAHRVNDGELPDLTGTDEDGADFFFVERSEPEPILATLKEIVAQRIPQRFGIQPREDVQVLTPMQRGDLGVARLNEELQEVLNAGAKGIARGHRQFRLGDRVMQLRNNYDLDVYNGDIGVVAEIQEDGPTLTVRYDDRLVAYETAQLEELVLAYASSIHKSQGSEYPVVIIPLHTQHYVMLQRNLLYTAMTRGRRLVMIIGSRRALELAVRNHQVQARRTRLAERLRHALEQPSTTAEAGRP